MTGNKTASGLPASMFQGDAVKAETSVFLAKVTQAVRLLSEARSLQEVTHLHGLSQAAEEYARVEKLGDEAEQYAHEVRLRAGRKAGVLLREMAKQGNRYRPRDTRLANKARHEVVVDDHVKTLSFFGITKDQSARWQKLAIVPEDVFEKAVEMGKGETAIAREARKARPPRDLRAVKSQHGKANVTEKQSLNGLRQAAVDLQSLAEGLDGHLFGDWSQLYDVEEAQEWFEVLAQSHPVVSARIKRVLRERGEQHGG